MLRIANVLAIVTLFLVSLEAYGSEYNSLLLRAQASVFPKIVMLDTDIFSKLKDNTVVLHVIHDPDDKKPAKNIKRLMEEHYGSKIGGHKLKIDLIEVGSSTDDIPVAYFVMNIESNHVREVASMAKANQRICFSYNHKDIDNNSLISLHLKEKVYIYLSKKQLIDYDIRFQPVFYNIVKVVE